MALPTLPTMKTLLPKAAGHLFPVALAMALLVPAQAWADATIVVRPTGTAKQRNIDKVTRSIGDSVAAVDGLALGEVEPGADCAVDPTCLASAGRDDGITKVVGVHLSTTGPTFTLLFIAVDAATGTELARLEIPGIKRKSLEATAGPSLLDFAKAIPKLVAEVPPPVEEPPVEEAPAPEEPVAQPPSLEMEASLEEEPANASYRVELGLGTGVLFPQLSSELSTSAGIELDVGVPVWKALSAVGAIGYSQPVVDSSLSDPRVAGNMYSTDTTQRELTITVGTTWRFLKPTSRLNAYGGVGPRVWLLETLTNGSANGMSFGENQETSTRFGAAAWGGVEFLIGPGAAAAELDVGGSDLPHAITGDVATTAAALQVGYRLRL